jgi:hypothetical protein
MAFPAAVIYVVNVHNQLQRRPKSRMAGRGRHSILRAPWLYLWSKARVCVCTAQREEMGFQSTRPLLPCVTYLMTNGCVHLLHNSSWKFHQLAAEQLLSGQPVRYGKGRRYGPSNTYRIIKPVGSLSSNQPGGSPCWGSPLAFGLIGTAIVAVC